MSGINSLLDAATASNKGNEKELYVYRIVTIGVYDGYVSIHDYENEDDFILNFMMNVLKENLEDYQYTMINKEHLRLRLRKVESEVEVREYHNQGYYWAWVINTNKNIKSYYVFNFEIDDNPWSYWSKIISK